MSSKNGDVDIGFDPLAWMNDTETPEDSENSAAAAEPAAPPIQDSVAEDVEEQPLEEVTVAESADTETDTPAASGDGFRVNLAGKTDITSAEQLKIELSNALSKGSPIILAAGEVERADGAALQLLTAFVRKLEDIDCELVWEEPSEQLIEAARIVGLREALHLP